MGPAPEGDDITIAQLGWRMEALEKRVDQGFAAVVGQVEKLAYVSKEVYLSEHVAQNERIAVATAKAEDAHRLTLWTLGLVITFVLAAIGAGLAKVVTA